MSYEELSQQIADLRALIERTNPPELMTSREAAQFLGVSYETVFRWRKDGEGPKYSQPTPRVVRYLRSDLLKFLEQEVS